MDSSNILISHLIFFAVGFFQDLLITYYYRTINKEWPVRAAISSLTVTIINLLVLYEILSGIETSPLSIIAAYALGNALGTFVVVKFHITK